MNKEKEHKPKQRSSLLLKITGVLLILTALSIIFMIIMEMLGHDDILEKVQYPIIGIMLITIIFALILCRKELKDRIY